MVISLILLELIFFLDQQSYNFRFISPYCYPKELCWYLIKRQENTEGGNEKRTIQRNWQHRAHKSKKKQNKNTTQYAWDTTIRKQIQTRHMSSHKQLWAKTNWTSFIWEEYHQKLIGKIFFYLILLLPPRWKLFLPVFLWKLFLLFLLAFLVGKLLLFASSLNDLSYALLYIVFIT